MLLPLLITDRMRPLLAGACTGLLGVIAAAGAPAPAAVAAAAGDCAYKAPRDGIVRSIDPRLCRAFALTRRSRRTGDVPPVEGREWVVLQGINPRLARRARTVGRRGMYLLPGRKTACLYVGGRYGGFSCKSHLDAARGRLQMIEIRPRSFTIFQLVPDGRATATLQVEGRQRRTLRVRGNAIHATVRGRRATGSVIWTDRAGRKHRRRFSVSP